MSIIRSPIQTLLSLVFVLVLCLFASSGLCSQQNQLVNGYMEFKYSPIPSTSKPPSPSSSDLRTISKHRSMSNHGDPIGYTFPREKTASERLAQELTEEEWAKECLFRKAVEEAYEAIEREKIAKARIENERKLIREQAQPALIAQAKELPGLIERTTLLNNKLTELGVRESYLQNRVQYLKDHTKDPEAWWNKQFSICNEDREFLKKHTLNPDEFYELYGNHLLHGIHSEHVALLSHARKIESLANNGSAQLHVSSFVVLAVQTSHYHNVKGNIITSLGINDVCFHILNPVQSGYLAGQLARLQTHIKIDESTHWKKALDCLNRQAQHDPGLRACLSATQKFAGQFNKANPDYELHVMHIMTELSLDELKDISIQKQFELLEKHHEAIAIEALRLLSATSTHKAPIIEYAANILNLDNPKNPENQKLIQTLLEPQDSLERTQKLISRPYHSINPNPFLTNQGILKEHALKIELHDLPIPHKQYLEHHVTPHELLYAYCTSNDPTRQKHAYLGLFHATRAAQCATAESARCYELLAGNYHDVLFNNKSDLLINWSNDLTRHYQDSYQQQVHDELVWLTHEYLATECRPQGENELYARILSEIENTLIAAHAYNQNNQPEKSHELIEKITEIFSKSNHKTKITSQKFLSHHCTEASANISHDLESTLNTVKIMIDRGFSTPEEQIEYVTNELSRLHIQSGRLVRDMSQLTEQELSAHNERNALRNSRSNQKKDLKTKLEHRAFREFDKKFPQFKEKLNREKYLAQKKQYVNSYYDNQVRKAHSSTENQLDYIITHINPHIPSIKVADAFGFIIETNDNRLDIKLAPENTLKDFKELWPTQEVINEIFELWDHEVPLYPLNSQAQACERYCARYDAYQATKDTPYIFTKKTYAISLKAQQLLDKNEIENDHLKFGTYNPIQHQLHTELLDILEQTTALDVQDLVGDVLRPTNTMMLDLLTTAAYANQGGDIIRTWNMADFCWASLDCGKALLEGVLEGSIDVATYAKDNPGEMLLYALPGNIMLYYQTTKLIYQLGSAAVAYAMNKPDPNAQTTKPIEFRDVVKGGASSVTQMYLNHKMSQKLTKVVTSAKSSLADKLMHEENGFLPKPVKNSLSRKKAPQTAEVEFADGSKETITLQNNRLGGQENKVPHKPNGSGGQNNLKNSSPSQDGINKSDLSNTEKWKQKAAESAAKKERIRLRTLKRAETSTTHQKAHARMQSLIEECNKHKIGGQRRALVEKIKKNKEFFFEKYQQDINDVHLEHGFELGWNINSEKLTGLHSTYYHPEYLISNITEPNTHGMFNPSVGKLGEMKESSMFPGNWNEKIMSDKIFECLLTGQATIAKDGTKYIRGLVQNYIKDVGIIPFTMELILDTDGVIRTYYPILEV